MAMTSLAPIVSYCDQLLKPEQFEDWEGACNGLQTENDGRVTRLAAAVDATLATLQMAVAAGADLLLVHHGLFWGSHRPWTGHVYRLLKTCLDGNLAVYSSHLPLDAHPRLGNNVRLCQAMGWKRTRPFFRQRGAQLGRRVDVRVPRDDLVARLEEVLGGAMKLLPGGPEVCRRIGVVTGGAGSELRVAAAEGVDTFITGEGPHWTYALAEELGINVCYGGHYATETFGVQALAAAVGRRFGLPWTYLDHPTGL
jgi:dinuclear metal center YbgI/SA1388 family protein